AKCGETTTPGFAAADRDGSVSGKDDNRDSTGRTDCGSADGREQQEDMRRDIEERVEYFNKMARECDEEDREEDGDKYRERVAAIQEVLSEHDKKQKEIKAMKNRGQKGMDWRSPTDAMRKRAKADEYDLDNPAVVSFLVKMQESCRKKAEAQEREARRAGGRGRDGGDATEREATWSEELWEGAILCMTRSEVTSFLKEELGVTRLPTEASLRELRDLAVSKVRKESCRAYTCQTGTNQPEERQGRADWKISAAITLLLFLFKSYQAGLFKWLATGGELTAGTARPPGFPSSSPAEGTSNRGGGTGRARGRATGKGRRDLAARSSVSGFDVDGGDGSSSSTAGTADSIGGAAIDGDSLAARALASATR
ncbi:unnamed protein product, partial [Pylaiella littoralis]